jgi:hypothetical protein
MYTTIQSLQRKDLNQKQTNVAFEKAKENGKTLIVYANFSPPKQRLIIRAMVNLKRGAIKIG